VATLLQIADAVADATKGPRPVSIANNSEPDAQWILRAINKVGTRLMREFPWKKLRAEHTCTASGNEIVLAAASMPAGFDRFVAETFWDRDSNNLLSGPVGPVEWNGLKVQTYSSQNKKFIHRGRGAGDILTQPVFAAGVNLSFEYVANTWVDTAAGGANKSAFSIDTDVTDGIDSELLVLGCIFEWLSSEGQPAGKAAREYQEYFNMLVGNDMAGSSAVLVAGDLFAQNTRHFTGIPKASVSSYQGDI